MATSEAQICNLAILRVGQRTETLQSLSGNSVVAKACAVIYPLSRDAVLEEFPWQFATKRLALALVADATRDGWTYVYALPTDCLVARYLYAGVRNPTNDVRVPFVLEDGSADTVDGQVLLTDLEDAVLVYTVAITSVARFPPLFVHALAWKIASELALSIPAKPQVGMAMDKGYQAALRLAAAHDFNESQGDADPDSELMRIR